jgi:FAD/FMN-containing dehydrogenase/Fe-S oxidoreductase
MDTVHLVPQAAFAPAGPAVDTDTLEAELRAAVAGEVRFDAGSRALYATDASNYRQLPIGVVIPRSVDDVVAAVRVCHAHGAPLLSRGGGTSLCGQCCNVAVVLDFSKYLNRVLSIDVDAKTARVQPGVVLDDLRHAAEQHGLTFAPDPATHSHNTLGGMIGNNSCGPHSVMGGETVHNIIALDVLTYDGVRMTLDANTASAPPSGRAGEIVAALSALGQRYAEQIKARFPPLPRRVSGYNLPALLPERGCNLAHAVVGSEGTCVVVLEATVRLLDNPPARTLLVLGYDSVYEAGDHVPEVMESGPIALEGMDDRLLADMKAIHLHPHETELLPSGAGWLLVEYGGRDKADADAQARALMTRLQSQPGAPSMKLFDDPAQEALLWKVRESGLGATAHVPDQPLTWEGWEDSSVPPERLGDYLRALRALLRRYDYGCDLYGHFGQGCVHTRINFDLETVHGIERYRAFIREAAELVVGMGGSISGEHGDGQSKAELLPIMFGEPLMQAFREFKRIWDPHWKMNPGKVIDAYRADENLRLGPGYAPKVQPVHFHYRDDAGDFSRALLRCVGVGECRKKTGTMCPSYMATGEERYSTRGRARLLFEMQRGETLRGGWREPAVFEALDLCLACKGCKGECPVQVDMATYKAEFLAHYYAHHARPAHVWAYAHIDRLARLGAHLPRAANLLLRAKPTAALLRRLGHVTPQRTLPVLATQTFTAWFARRAPPSASGLPVILWPDTFNNHFHPHVLRAAVHVLEHAGCRVILPPAPLCCGRPLYEAGLVEQARARLRQVLDALADAIHDGVPVVGLEPACLSVFHDELPALFPYDVAAHRLREQTLTLAEFLLQRCPDLRYPHLARRAVVHEHCHQKAVLHTAPDRTVLARIGLDANVLDAGCCGMAGAFGYDRDKYEVSMACAERVLLPAVRAAAPTTLLIANGYSCREQIVQATARMPLHLAEALAEGWRAEQP